jgi:hypothetical protein
MATRLAYAKTVVDVKGYTSSRVFIGMRPLPEKAAMRHVDRLKRALAKLPKE